nr:uncharacterized protein LOC112040091 isoform X1 [Quercus suber]
MPPSLRRLDHRLLISHGGLHSPYLTPNHPLSPPPHAGLIIGFSSHVMPEKFMQKKLTNFIEKHSSQKGLLLTAKPFRPGALRVCMDLMLSATFSAIESRQLNILNLIIALLNPLAKKDWIRYVHLWLTPARTLTNLPSKADPNCVLTVHVSNVTSCSYHIYIYIYA